MPQHYENEFETYEEQRRILERLRQQIPFQVEQARQQVELIYGTKQENSCHLLNDAELMRRCRQGYTPEAQTYNPVGTYPNGNEGNGGNGNGSDGNGNGGGGDA